jgi:hypothetical protein
MKDEDRKTSTNYEGQVRAKVRAEGFRIKERDGFSKITA